MGQDSAPTPPHPQPFSHFDGTIEHADGRPFVATPVPGDVLYQTHPDWPEYRLICQFPPNPRHHFVWLLVRRADGELVFGFAVHPLEATASLMLPGPRDPALDIKARLAEISASAQGEDSYGRAVRAMLRQVEAAKQGAMNRIVRDSRHQTRH